MNFLSKSEQNLQELIVRGQEKLEQRVIFECEVMAKHILDEGKTISEALLEELKDLREALDSGQESRADFHRAAHIHARFCEIIKPARPGTLAHLHEERESRSWLRFLGPVPFFRTMMLVAIVFLFSLIGLSLSSHINVVNVNKGIFEHDGIGLLVNLLFLVTAAGLGAVFAALYEANQTLRARTFDPELAPAYWARLAMGLVAGIILAELVPVRPPAGGIPGMDAGSGMVDSTALAQLGGDGLGGGDLVQFGDTTGKGDSAKSQTTVPLRRDSLVRGNMSGNMDQFIPVNQARVASDSAGILSNDSSRMRNAARGSEAQAKQDSLGQDAQATDKAIGEASRGGVMKVIVAVLGGFSANLLFNILIKMGNALENVVGSGDDIMGRIQQLDRRIQEQSQQEVEAASPKEKRKAPKAPPPPVIAPAPQKKMPSGPPAKMFIDLDTLTRMMPNTKRKTLEKYLYPLNRAFGRYEITTPLRIAHFIAQVGHESGSFRWPEEIWSKPALDANGVATKGTKFQLRYEGRKDLGNTEVGDGYRFRGRGLIQLTGRNNYKRYSDYLIESGYPLSASLTEQPDLVGQPELAVDSAAWFWRRGRGPNLNEIADQDDVVKLTRRINGGTNGLEDRKQRLAHAKSALNL